MCDHAIKWGSQVKLSFNPTKSVYLLFSRKRIQLPEIPFISVNGTKVLRSRECLYLGLTIDDKLCWRSHISNKCKAASRIYASIRRCFSLTWGLSSDKLALLYKATIVPIISYGCVAWAPAINTRWCKMMLRSAQRPMALAICRAFRSTSTSAALVLANMLPLDLKILEIVCHRSFSGLSLSPSASFLISETIIKSSVPSPPGVLELGVIKRRITRLITEKWEEEWANSVSGAITKEFFPTVSSAKRPSCALYHPETTQILTGHSYLNFFQSKFNADVLHLCACQSDVETVHHMHFLSDCPLHERGPLKFAITQANLNWPPKLSDFPLRKSTWLALEQFIRHSKRLLPPV